MRALEPALAPRVRLHDGPAGIMEEHGVTAELERALRSKVWLPAGGYIVINQTEALVAIDVNTGRFVGKNQLEETMLKANLDAVREIVRQIRLRDLGGIIVVDFIDMEERKSRREVMRALEQELRKRPLPDEAALGERVRPGDPDAQARQAVARAAADAALPVLLGQRAGEERRHGLLGDLRRGAQARGRHARKRLVLRVNPEVARALGGEEASVLKGLAALVGGDVTLQADPLLHQEQFDVVAV